MEERKYKRWTDEEDRVLIAQVSRSPENLTKAYETAARLLGRTKLACQYRWVKYLRDSNAVAFTLIGSTYAMKNSKVRGEKRRMRKSIWTWIKDLFK